MILKIVLFGVSLILNSRTYSATGQETKDGRVVCYFTNWSIYRPIEGRLLPSEIDPSLCTNVVYAFASVNFTSLELSFSDKSADLNYGLYRQITSIASKGVTVSLSMSGAGDSKLYTYSQILNDEKNRTRFVNNVVKYMEKYNFRGFDVDIEFPACPKGNCTAGNPDDKEGFAAMLKMLYSEFQPKGWVLSAAISASPKIINAAYNIEALNKYLDWIGVMTYDYHSYRNGMTGSNSPLYSRDGDPAPDFNINSTIQYLLHSGVQPNKLIIGVPLYSRTFTLKNIEQNAYWAPTIGPGKKGPVTKATGILAYYEVCELIAKSNWTAVEDKNMGSYIYKENQWASYLSIDDIHRRVSYAKEYKLGGALIWEMSFDDFRGEYCNQGKFPLLRAINEYYG